MTAALYDEVVTVAPARTLTVVREDTIQPLRPPRPRRSPAGPTPSLSLGGDPLVEAPLGC